jgi:hypothetical protein
MGYVGPSAVHLPNRLERVCYAPGIYQPRHSDTNCVERDDRSGKKTHVEDVAGGGDDCCANKNGQYRIPHIPPHPARRNHPHQGEKEYENGHFENQPESDDDRQK